MLVIGNGESRKNISLDSISDTKIGCNAIMRDYFVDHIICVDKRMVNEAVSCNINSIIYVYTRKEWLSLYSSYKNICPVPELPYVGAERWDLPIHWGSGPYAVLLAAALDKNVNLIGFDLYGIDNKVNNIYKDTTNYDTSDKKAVDPRYWIHQIGMVFQCHPRVNFKIYQEPGWQLPQAWNYTNVSVDKISNIYYNT